METVGSNLSQYTPQSTKGVPVSLPQPSSSERGSMTTREQRKLIKEDQLIGREALSGAGLTSDRANASKVFSFAFPRNNQDVKGQP